MAKLGDLLGKRFIGRLGGGVLIDEDGLLIAHPVSEHVRAGRLARDVARDAEDEVLATFVDGRGRVDGRAFADLRSFGVEGEGWFYERPIERNAWRLGLAIFENELPRATVEMRRRLLLLLLTGFASIALTLGLVLRVDRLRDVGMWIFVTVFTLVCVAAIVCVWTASLDDAKRLDGAFEGPASDGGGAAAAASRVVADASSLEEFQREHEERARALRKASKPSFVPTGLELESLRFVDGESVQVGGIVWQLYDDEAHKGLDRAIRFANLAPDAEGLSLEEISRHREGTAERIVWEFRGTLRVRFDFRLYPFDRQRVPIALVHPAVDKDVVLTPDLARYSVLNSSAKPGVAELVLPGWSLLESHFAYTMRKTSIGFGAVAGRSEVPELEFQVTAQRQVLSPFLSYLVPLLIVMALLHGVLISSSFNSDKKSNSGFSTFGVLETSGAFFFAIVFMHIDLRGALSLDTITYLEALYIVAYSMLILVAVNSLVFTETDAIAVLEYRDNLIAKLLY